MSDSHTEPGLRPEGPAPPSAPSAGSSRGRGRGQHGARYHPFRGRSDHYIPAQPHIQPGSQALLVTTARATQPHAGRANHPLPAQRHAQASAQPAPAVRATTLDQQPSSTASHTLTASQQHPKQAHQAQCALSAAKASRLQQPHDQSLQRRPARPPSGAASDLPMFNLKDCPSLARPRSTTQKRQAPTSPPLRRKRRRPYQREDEDEDGENIRESPPVCDENPAFFPGTTNILLGHERCLLKPPTHSGDILPCANTYAHYSRPHRVCLTCQQRGERHIKATNPNLLCMSYVPLCCECARGAIAKQQNKNGRIESCTCFRVSEENWLCFDCRESKLMNMKACWEAETMEGNGLSNRMERFCRCGTQVKDWSDGNGNMVKVGLCVSCEGLDARRYREVSREA